MNREIIQNMVKLELDKQLQALQLESKSINVAFKLVDENIETVIPQYKTPGSSGMDICSCEEVTISSGETKVIKTNLSFDIPDGYQIEVCSRSGLSAKNSIFVLNSPGICDSDYRGEIMVILHNLGKEEFKIKPGDRIAQIILSKVSKMILKQSDKLSETNRGSGGLGSTGINSEETLVDKLFQKNLEKRGLK